MKRVNMILSLVFFMCFTAAGTFAQTYADDFFNALQGGKFSGSLRVGYEYSDLKQSPAVSPASAFNVQTRLNYRTGEFMQTSAFIELQNVSNIEEDFCVSPGCNRQRDVIADPEGSRIEQAYLDFKFLPQTTIRLGRQNINLDDQRLIGTIQWRQNAQVFDALSITNKSVPDTTIFLAYVDRVNTIKLTHIDLDALYLINATYAGIKGHKLTAFCYLLDSTSKADSGRDSATYGVRAAGKVAMLNYAVDYAHQSDFADSDNTDADMFNAYLAGKITMVTIGAGYSYISGQDDNDKPFDTLFSTAHKFNGWADDFLSTNGGRLVNGLSDYYADISIKYMGAKFKAVYHYFDSTDDSANGFDDAYGDEIDLLAVKKLHKNVKGLLKYAHYNERNSSAINSAGLVGGHDEDVFWTRLMIKF